MGFGGWPLKGLPFLEIEQGEVQGKVTPRSPALREHDAGMGGQAEFVSSPWLLHTAGGITTPSESELGQPSCRACFKVQQQGLAVSS